MAGQWEEEQHLEKLIEIGRLDGSFLKLEVMRKVPELVVNDRMSGGKRVKNPKEKKNVPVWSVEEMKERPNILVEEDTEEIGKWRGFKPERN